MPSATLEEYLETIYKISLRGEVRPSQIADALGVAPPTVTSGLKRLETAGLITRSEGGIVLTDTGRVESVSIVRRHRIAEKFLVDVLGLGLEAAHDEACRLEHALSEQVLEALERFLDSPAACPHGHPIPRVDGELPVEWGVPLSELQPCVGATVVSVPEEDETLAYLSDLGLRPGAHVTVDEIAPFEGPLLVTVGSRRAAMDRAIAGSIVVRVEV